MIYIDDLRTKVILMIKDLWSFMILLYEFHLFQVNYGNDIYGFELAIYKYASIILLAY